MILQILAIVRLTKIIVDDKISIPVFDKINDLSNEYPVLKYVTEMMDCPDCTSVWASFVILFFTDRNKYFFIKSLAYSLIAVAFYNIHKNKIIPIITKKLD